MPRAKKGAKTARRGRKTARKVAKRMSNSEIANCKQTISSKPMTFSANNIYGLYNFSLSASDRAVQIAKAYQYYRITKIELIVKANQDTFGTNALSVPYLYYQIDKAGSFVNANLDFNSLRDAGSKPLRIDDKSKRIVFKPTVLINTLDQGAATKFPMVRTSPWLCTNANNLVAGAAFAPDSTDHYGCALGLEQDNVAIGASFYDVDMVIHYQFKKPRFQSVSGGVPKVMVDLTIPGLGPVPPGYTPGLVDN